MMFASATASSLPIAFLNDSAILGGNGSSTQRIVSLLRQQGLNLVSVDAAQLAGPSTFNVTVYSALLLTNARLLPAKAAINYHTFALGGGGLILFGQPPRLNTSASQIGINLMSRYEPYFIAGTVTTNTTAALHSILGDRKQILPTSNAHAIQGVSAVGWLFPAENQFVPLLDLQDEYNRSVGWGLSLVNNQAGAYKGGRWIFSGVDEPAAFYQDPQFISVLASAVKRLFGSPATTLRLPPQPLRPLPQKRQHRKDSTNRFVHLTDDKKHLLLPRGGRYFLLGGDYFRGQINDSLTPSQLRIDLGNAVWAGLNTVRVYGLQASLLRTVPAMREVFEEFEQDHGLRILFTVQCYKDEAQRTAKGIISRTSEEAQALGNASWVMGYDLCNEPDDQNNYFGEIVINTTIAPNGTNVSTCLKDLYPAVANWGDFEKWFCGGWSTTFDAGHCKPLVKAAAMSAALPTTGAVRKGYEATDAVFGYWLKLRTDAIHAVEDELNQARQHPRHLITVGHNALHALLPSNGKYLDFVSHHSYPSNPTGNLSSTYASMANVSAVPLTTDALATLWADSPRPITFGEFGTKTTAGLWTEYLLPLQVSPSLPTAAALQDASGPSSATATSSICTLSDSCCSGVASTIGWFMHHGGSFGCSQLWSLGVDGNAGPKSTHHRCPVDGGTGPGAWLSATYQDCKTEIIAAGAAFSPPNQILICNPPNASSTPPVSALDFHTSAAWDLLTWLHALETGRDGALRWSLAEKSYPHAVRADTWTGNDQTDKKAHDAYVSGGRWGYFWYNGSPQGLPKPIAFATKFLRAYLDTAGDAAFSAPYKLTMHTAAVPRQADGSSWGMGVGYTFEGPNVLVVTNGGSAAGSYGHDNGMAAGGHSSTASQIRSLTLRLNFTVARTGMSVVNKALVPVTTLMLRWTGGVDEDDGLVRLMIMSTNDCVMDLDTIALVAQSVREPKEVAVVGKVGRCTMLQSPTGPAVARLYLLQGEEVAVGAAAAGRGSCERA
jgi:hypothetical protein